MGLMVNDKVDLLTNFPPVYHNPPVFGMIPVTVFVVGRPLKNERRNVNGILWILKTGVAWR